MSLVVGVLAMWLGWLIHRRVIAADHPLSWDEGAHSLFGLAIATDLRRGDLLALAYDTYRQVYWPPLHSWLVGLSFLAFGDGISIARDVSLAAYGLLPLALVAAGRLLQPGDDSLGGWTAAAVAGVLAVSVPAFIPMATLAFLDLPALLALTLTLAAAFFAESRPDEPRRRILIAAGILATFFTKTNYGLLLLIAFALDALIDAGWSVRRLVTRRNLYVVVPIVAVLAIWFAYPPKIVSTWRAMVNAQSDSGEMTLESLLFYPRTLLTFAGSPVMLAVLIASIAGAWPLRRMPNVRLLLLVAGIQFLLGELHHTKEDRHLLPMMPALLLLAGSAGARAARWAGQRWTRHGVRRLTVGAWGLFVALVVTRLWTIVHEPFPRAYVPAPPGIADRTLVDLVRGRIGQGERVLLVSAFDVRPMPPALDWRLAVDERLLEIEHSGAIAVVDRDRGVASAIERTPLPALVAEPVTRVLRRADAPARVRTIYGGLPERATPDAFAASIAETLRRDRPDVVIVARSATDPAKYPASYFGPLVANRLLTLTASQVVGSTRLEEYRVAR